jgi:prophage DNA circulation protein
MPDTYEAMLDGYVLEIRDISDEFQKSIARYEFPYRDGALLDDMGQKARTVRFRCYFYGSEAAYNSHIEFLNHLESQDLSELVHPKYGVMEGSIESVSVRHDKREFTAEVDITFVENLRGAIEPVEYPDVEASAEESFISGQDEQMSEFSDDVTAALGVEAASILDTELDPSLPVTGQFSGISLTARNYLKKVDTYLSTLNATLSDISNPATGLIASIDYGVNLPGIVIGAVAACAERHAVLYDPANTAPTRFIQSLKNGLLDLEDDSDFAKHTKIASAQRCGLELAYIYKQDEQTRNEVRQAEKKMSFDILGRYIQRDKLDPIMTVNEIEQTLFDTRSVIQDAVDLSRSMHSLKDLARDLLVHVNTIKLEREKIVEVDIHPRAPLHVICLKYGLSYQYAERIHSINSIANPNFAQGEINVYAK